MIEDKLEMVEFLRGMAWHDAGKPFQLGTKGHMFMGCWLLRLAGYPQAAWVALTHGGDENLKHALKAYFASCQDPLPAVLLLANPLDMLAASAYSLLSRRIDIDAIKKTYPVYHAWQNPFSRLPLLSPELSRSATGPPQRFIAREDQTWRRDTQIDHPLQHALAQRTAAWPDFVTPERLEHVSKGKGCPMDGPAPAGAELLHILGSFMQHYPERTFPPANDTALDKHCRLSSVLAFVVLSNLSPEGWVGEKIRQDSDGLYTVENGKRFKVSQLLECPTDRATNQKALSMAQRQATAYLDGYLVRIVFSGCQDAFEKAVRVDDLHGARRLTDMLRQAVKRTLAGALAVAEWADGLAITESRFDLIYLLPARDRANGAAEIKDLIDAAYREALEVAAGQLIGELNDHFYPVRQAPLFDVQDTLPRLCRELGEMAYGVRIIPVEAPTEQEIRQVVGQNATFSFFEGATFIYGRRLLQAYEDSLKSAPGCSFVSGWPLGEGLAADQTCSVCGNHLIVQAPAGLSEDELARWTERLGHATHTFRDERERPCLACVARRLVSHGTVAKDAIIDRALDQMVKWADDGSDRLVAVPPQDGRSLPPTLLPQVTLKPGEFVDMKAVYAASRRGRQGQSRSLDLFPTIGYAADANSNVVMLSLRPTAALWRDYHYDAAVETALKSPIAQDVIDGTRAPETTEELWYTAFAWFYKAVKETCAEQTAANVLEVKPHLARVMTRIQHVQDFYNDLYRRLADTPPHRLRVLPLDTAYPNLRLLLPADQLDQALQILDQAITQVLFSAVYPPDPAQHQQLHALLSLVAPDLLHGAVVLFKLKYPLYLVLEAERDLFRRLQARDPVERPTDRPGNRDWYGVKLAFSDLRGTLSQVGPLLAQVTWAELGPVLRLAGQLDRRTVAGRAGLVNGAPGGDPQAREALTDLADALMRVRAGKQGQRQAVTELLAKGPDGRSKFDPVLFIKTAVRK